MGTMEHRAQVEEIARQIGSTLMPDNAVWTNRFTIQSTSSTREYVVAQRRTDGVWGCGCPGWRHYRRCKHTTDLLRRLANLPAAAKVLDADVLSMLESARTAYLDLDGAGSRTPIRHREVANRVLDL
jgi:hypothetical protein